MRTREYQVKFYLNRDELSLLKEKLAGSHLSMAEFFRRLLAGAEMKAVPLEVLRDIQKQVRGVGRNVNQIAKLAHISGNVPREALARLAAEQEKIEEQLGRLM